MTIPQKLSQGDTVAIIAPSGVVNPEKLYAGVKVLEGMGLRVEVMPSCHGSYEYLAAPDHQRLSDLHTAFANKKIKAIFAGRGGYGAARLLPHLNIHLIRQNPKIFAGYSDITALHIAINQQCNLATYHAPMPAADLPTADPQTLRSFFSTLFNPQSDKGGRGGVVPELFHGILTGGNLTVIASTLGTPYEIDTRGKVLFLEEIGEPPYRIDRLLVQLKQAGKLRDATGFILGDFSPENLATIKLAISELLIPEGKPIIAGVPCGHCMPNVTLPLGQDVGVFMESLHQLQICGHFRIEAERKQFG